MVNATDVVSLALSQVGKKESPPNSNEIFYNDWYYDRHVSGPDYPWCMVFCQWVYDQLGVKVPIRTASCTKMLDASKETNSFVNNRHMEPGDLVLFDFARTGRVSTHCGILVSINGIKMEVVEGNTAIGNDTNGGTVMLRNRTTSQAIGAFHPRLNREEGLDMTKAEFLKSLTDEEAYILLTKAMTHASTKPEPSWSKKEGHWADAIAKKIITNKSPEGYLKADELIAIMGRLGLISK